MADVDLQQVSENVPAPGSAADPAAPGNGRHRQATSGQWTLVWRRFRRHRLALVSAVVMLLIYLVAIFAEFIAPYGANTRFEGEQYAPPSMVRVVERGPDGLQWGLHTHGYQVEVNEETQRRTMTVDPDTRRDITLFGRGEPYELFGLIPMDRHLFAPTDAAEPVYLMGTDRLGRDMFSRVVHGTRISMSIGLVGVALSMFFGIVFGGLSGYFGGAVDTGVQRVIEFMMSIPTLPLWMMLAASLPDTWGPVTTYFGITVILSLVGWTDLARVVRGRFLSLREEEFVEAARLDGCSTPRIMRRYMLPSFSSHIIASLTLAIPAMILAETSLSFLGLGLQPPVVSWGVLLQEAQNIRTVITAPWLLLPGIAVVVSVLALNFVGDGLRDSADPYS